jgi:hypothetical protein
MIYWKTNIFVQENLWKEKKTNQILKNEVKIIGIEKVQLLYKKVIFPDIVVHGYNPSYQGYICRRMEIWGWSQAKYVKPSLKKTKPNQQKT